LAFLPGIGERIVFPPDWSDSLTTKKTDVSGARDLRRELPHGVASDADGAGAPIRRRPQPMRASVSGCAPRESRRKFRFLFDSSAAGLLRRRRMGSASRSSLLTIAVYWLPLGVGVPAFTMAQDLRVEHVTIVSPERASPMRDAAVTIHDGRIASISSGTAVPPSGTRSVMKTIDGRGLYLTPGLIDSHVHLGSIPGMTDAQEAQHADIARATWDQMPRSFLLYGFTTLIDLVSTPAQISRWKSHDVVPDTYFCGGAALMDGYPMSWFPKPGRYQGMPYMLIEPGTTAPAGFDPAMHTPQAVVARMKTDGAICVKTFYEHGFGPVRNLPVPRIETIQALVRAAHAAGLPVLLHANSSEAQAFGLRAGVDILAHGLWNDDASSTIELTPAEKEILDGVVAAHVGWQPTIQVLYGLRDLFNASFLSDPLLARVVPSSLLDWYRSPEGQWFHDELAREFADPKDPAAPEARVDRVFAIAIGRDQRATAYLGAHGARLLFGTDTPSAPTYANPPGLNGWLEMQRLLAAGETPAQIFRSATLSNAEALKLDRDVGTVQVDKRANLLLLQQDPTQTIQAYAGIVKVILGGRVLDPADLAANRAQPREDSLPRPQEPSR
jgi:imidazolonepropionase-like amidohydrolase